MEQNLPRKKADKTGIAFFEEVPKGNGFNFNTSNSSGNTSGSSGTQTYLLELTSNDTTTDYNSSTPQAIDWTSVVVATPDATSDIFEWTSGADGSKIYVRQDGYYKVNTMTSYAIESGSGAIRLQLSNRLRVDGSTFINGTDYTSYARNSVSSTQVLNYSSTHLTGVVQLSSGSYIESIVTQAGSNGVANLDENQSLFIIEKL